MQSDPFYFGSKEGEPWNTATQSADSSQQIETQRRIVEAMERTGAATFMEVPYAIRATIPGGTPETHYSSFWDSFVPGVLTIAGGYYAAAGLAGATGGAAAGGAAAGGAAAAETGAALAGLTTAEAAAALTVAEEAALLGAASTSSGGILSTIAGAANMNLSDLFTQAAKSTLTNMAVGAISNYGGAPVAAPQQTYLPGEWDMIPGFTAPNGAGGVYGQQANPMVQQAVFPGLMAAGRIASGAGLVGGAMSVAAGLVRTASGAIRGVMTTAGKFISSKKAVALAKRVGLDTAAVALGIGAVDLAQMVLADSARRGRGRGITAASMRTTKRTMRAVMGLHRQIVQACSSSGFGRRRSSGSSRLPRFISAKASCK